YVPPGRKSISQSNGLPRPHHRRMCSHALCARNTSSRGASKTRVRTISRSDGVVTVRAPLLAWLIAALLQLVQVVVEVLVALLPEPPVLLGPLRDPAQRCRYEPAGSPLGIAATGDQPRALQHLQVFGDRLKAHRERRGQLVDRGLALRQPGQDGAAGRVGERREHAAELVCCHCYQPSG